MEYNYGIIPNVCWDIHDWKCTPNDGGSILGQYVEMVGWPFITMDHALVPSGYD